MPSIIILLTIYWQRQFIRKRFTLSRMETGPTFIQDEELSEDDN